MLRGGGPPGESPSARSSRCVFVGNIPYDASEESLIEIFQEAGPVVSFRLVFDKEKGKPKGYGFCEYRDAETAQSAIRNLNNVELNGRPLRVDFAENEKGLVGEASGRGGASNTRDILAKQQPTNLNQRQPSQQENVTSLLEGMSHNQLYDVIWKMKLLIQQNTEQARRILAANPPLSYALLQALVILGAVDAGSVQQLLQNTMQTPTGPPTQPTMVPSMNIPPGMSNIPPMQPMNVPGMAPGMAPSNIAPGMGPNMAPMAPGMAPGPAQGGMHMSGFPPGVRPIAPGPQGQQFGPQGGFGQVPPMGQPMMPQMGPGGPGPRGPMSGGSMMGMQPMGQMGPAPGQIAPTVPQMGLPPGAQMGLQQLQGSLGGQPMMMDQNPMMTNLQEQQLIQQLLSLTPQKLQQLSPAERQQVQQLQMMFQKTG